MAPGEIGAVQDDQIGKLDVFINTRHGIIAEGAFVPGNGRGHAKPRIGIDIGRADKAFHQLVGDVVVLR
ncbi:hypothetical protein D3C87_2110840 [compost metagenome]